MQPAGLRARHARLAFLVRLAYMPVWVAMVPVVLFFLSVYDPDFSLASMGLVMNAFIIYMACYAMMFLWVMRLVLSSPFHFEYSGKKVDRFLPWRGGVSLSAFEKVYPQEALELSLLDKQERLTRLAGKITNQARKKL